MDVPAQQLADLFAWTDGRVVLFFDRDRNGWIVARGWRRGDRLADIRRWTFDSPARATGQIRRLVEEATGDATAAAATSVQLTDWLASRHHAG